MVTIRGRNTLDALLNPVGVCRRTRHLTRIVMRGYSYLIPPGLEAMISRVKKSFLEEHVSFFRFIDLVSETTASHSDSSIPAGSIMIAT